MITENISTLQIHRLTQEQYDRELEAGRIDENALYLTPDTPSIVDVVELPQSNIQENVFYRLLTASFVIYTGEKVPRCICYCVDTLPVTGEVVTDATFDYFIGYYNVNDNVAYGYVDEVLGSGFGVPAGWYPFEALASTASVGFNGVITNIEDCPDNNYYAILLEYNLYIYQNGWCKTAFGYEQMPEFDIKWDGVIGDRFALDVSALGFPDTYFVKVSDSVFTVDQLIGATVTQSDGFECIITDSDIDASTYAGAINVTSCAVIVHTADELNAALGLPSGYITNGTYFVYVVDVDYTNRLVAPSKITKIDRKFLDIDDVDLSYYATKIDLLNYALKTDLSNYATQSWVDNKDYVTYPDMSGYISLHCTTKSEVQTMINTAIGDAIGGSY